MPITMNDLTISPHDVAMDKLLTDWKWAVPEPLRPVLLTAMGDVFAQGESGAVYFIDVVGGDIEAVSDDGATFQSLLRDNQFVTDFFFPSRIVELRKAGKSLQPQQVYSHICPMVLGGPDELSNIEPTDVLVHVSVHGQIHRQIKDLPEGASISQITVDGEIP